MNKYKLYYLVSLFFNLFPSFSVSVFFSNIFIQPRYFAIPFLLLCVRSIINNFENRIFILFLLISLFVPIAGFFFGRQSSLLDIALIVNWVYLLLFFNATLKYEILFHYFINLFLWMNLVYIIFQLIVYYLGFPQLTMLHSNVPFHVESGYMIEPSFFDWLPRYTGLFIESGPLTLFLCFTYLFIIQYRDYYSKKLRFFVLLVIVFSQSKFLILFLPFLMMEYFFIIGFPKQYKKIIHPASFSIVLTLIVFFIYVVFAGSNLNDHLVKNLISYELRFDAIKESVERFANIGLFGNIFQGSNYDASSGSLDLQKWDIFSILFYGYGVFFGAVFILLILAIPIFADIQYKFSTVAVLILAFLSSGSLLVPQYTFALIFCGLLQFKSKSVGLKHNVSLTRPVSNLGFEFRF